VRGRFKLADLGFCKFVKKGERDQKTFLHGGTEAFGMWIQLTHSLLERLTSHFPFYQDPQNAIDKVVDEDAPQYLSIEQLTFGLWAASYLSLLLGLSSDILELDNIEHCGRERSKR
jgi:hypothetical protein